MKTRAAPLDAAVLAGLVGLDRLARGDLGSLVSSDDSRVVVNSAASGNRPGAELEVTLNTSADASSLEITIETACTTNPARSSAEIFDQVSGGWAQPERFRESKSDVSRTYPVSSGSRDIDGTGILIRITTDRRGGGFTTGVDQIRVVAVP